MKNIVTYVILSPLIFLFLSGCLTKRVKYNFNNVVNVKVEQINQFGNFVIYDESDYPILLDKILKAKRISENSCEKAAILDGEYVVKVKTDKETFIFELQNSYWIYDVNNEIFLRCNLLDELRKKSNIKVYYEDGKLKLKKLEQ